MNFKELDFFDYVLLLSGLAGGIWAIFVLHINDIPTVLAWAFIVPLSILALLTFSLLVLGLIYIVISFIIRILDSEVEDK